MSTSQQTTIKTGKNLFLPIIGGMCIATTCWVQTTTHATSISYKLINPPEIRVLDISDMQTPLDQRFSPISVKEAISQIRLLTSFSQEALAGMLSVDRRTIYHWIGGQEPAEGKAERIMRLLSTLQFIDRGAARLNKKILTSPVGNGKLLKDYLIEERYDEVMRIAGPGNHSPAQLITSPGISSIERGRMSLSEMLAD